MVLMVAVKSQLSCFRLLSTNFVSRQRLRSAIRLPFHLLLVTALVHPLAAVTLDCGQAFPNVHHRSSYVRGLLARERLLHCSLDALDVHRRLPSMSVPGSAPGAITQDHGLFPVDSLVEYFTCRTRQRTLSRSTEELSNAMLSMKMHMKKESGDDIGFPSSLIKWREWLRP